MKNQWQEVMDHGRAAKSRRILDLFNDENRADAFSARMSAGSGDMLFDYSKTALDGPARASLLALATDTGVAAARDAMFAGEKINRTEGRAVLHSVLRSPMGGPVLVDGEDVMPNVRVTLERMQKFATQVRNGGFTGQGGTIRDVVNIGIGGSDLGPAMAVQALKPYHTGPRCHFVSNVDGADIHDTLSSLDPKTTLIVVASKTFTTIETMTNAQTARDWMAQMVDDPGAQFVALSTAEDKTAQFGVSPDRVFGFEDWVGGRYSVWGPIGLSLMIAIGPDEFDQFLAGGAAMDAHFCETEFGQNLPVLLALVGIWHHQVLGYGTRAVLPYDQRLKYLPAYLQQLEMESNGKRIAMDGSVLKHGGGPVIWGEPGTNGQHAFYQLIHQGAQIIPCEFMIAAQGHEPELAHHHTLLMANCLAQSEALMRGRTINAARALMADQGYDGAELEMHAAHREFAGNRPSVTLAYTKLDPFTLGQIIALYEHRVFVEGVILGLNSFDQWGVELGKELATALAPVLTGDENGEDKDGSTRGLIAFLNG